MDTKRYLPLIDTQGNWIERPDLFLLARMARCDDEDERIVHQVYEVMARADNSQQSLNSFESDFSKRQIHQNLRHRRFAGQVVLSAVRIVATTNRPVSASQAIMLCAHRQLQIQKNSCQLSSLIREVERGFSGYRNTAHLQATRVLLGRETEDIETSGEKTPSFLARARALEHFLDINVMHEAMHWNPWRVPECIDPNNEIEIKLLSVSERSLLNLN